MPVLPTLESSQSVFSQGALGPQQIQSSPADFGGNIAEAGQQVGQAGQQAGADLTQVAVRQADLQRETDANNQYANVYSPALRDATQKYYTLQGKDAVDALPQYEQALQTLQQQQLAQLKDPIAQHMFNEVSTRRSQMELDGMARYADTQNKVYQQQASSGMVESFQQTAAQHWNDPNAFNGSLQSIAIERQSHAMTVGQPVEYTNAQIATDVSGAWVDRLKGYASSGQAAQALSLLNNGEDWTDTRGATHHTDVRSQILPQQLPAIQSELSSHVADQVGVQYGNTATAPPPPAPGTGSVGIRNNNPGNLKDPMTGQFQTFASQSQGVQAADQNLLAYQTKHGIDTISGITNRWAPAGDGNNNPVAYAATVAAATGIPADQKIDLTNPAVRTKVLNAMFDVETPGWKGADQQASGAANGAVTGTLPVANVSAVPNAASIAPPAVGTSQDPATLRQNQDANSESARQAAQQHTLDLTGDPIAAKRAGDIAAATVVGNTNAAIAAQESRQRAASGAMAKLLSGDPSSNTAPITSFQQLMGNANAYANYKQMSQEGQAAVVERLSNQGKTPLTADGLKQYYGLRGQAVNDPTAFQKVDLSTLYGQMPEAQILDLVNRQTALAKGDSAETNKSLNWNRTKGDVDDMLKPLGLGNSAKAGSDESKSTEQFYGKLQESLEQYHDANQKYPDTAATRKMAGALLTQGTQGNAASWLPGWAGGSTTMPAFQSPDLSKFSVPVPDAQKPQLAASFQKVMGHPPTDDELTQWYTRYSLAQKGSK